MYDDWTKCHECESFDGEKYYCKKMLRTVTIGCPYGDKAEPKTKGDELRAMDNEHLADFMLMCGTCPVRSRPCTDDSITCKQCWLDYLNELRSEP